MSPRTHRPALQGTTSAAPAWPGRRLSALCRAALCLLATWPLGLAAQNAPGLAADGLPPEPLMRQALLQSPAQDQAHAGWRGDLAAAEQQRLGPYDWVLRAGLQRRSERAGDSFGERELALERTLRWGNKAALDQALADQAERLAALRLRSAWRDSAMALLDRWFDARRGAQAAGHQQAQVALAQAQVDTLRRRVNAGDAAAWWLRQAEGELARTQAALASAEQQALSSRQALLRQYPALAPAWPGSAPAAADALQPATDARAQGVAPATAAAAAPGQRDAAADDAAALAARLIDSDPALAQAQAELALVRQQLDRLRADRRADPTVGVRVAQERGGAERVLGISVAIPFGAALRDSRVQGGQAALDAAEARLAARQIDTATESERLATAPAQRQAMAERLATAASTAETSTRLTARAQSVGEATLADLQQQRRQAGDAALAASLAALDLQQARARLRLALQQLLPETTRSLP